METLNSYSSRGYVVEFAWLLGLLKKLGFEPEPESDLENCEKAFFAYAGRKPMIKGGLLQFDQDSNMEYPDDFVFTINRRYRSRKTP